MKPVYPIATADDSLYYENKSIMRKLMNRLSKLRRFMKVRHVVGAWVLAIVISVLGLVLYLDGKNVAMLNPQGIIADKQLSLLIFTTVLGLIVIIPVFIMLFAFAWKYREGNTRAKYAPEEEGNRLFETLWWGIPIIIIIILSVVTWVSTHDLDPYRQLQSSTKPVRVQVVALQWRWLFIYPDQKIASLNEVRFPEQTPINFEITGDAPMSAFWIPSLGSQVYAMNGMTSQLKLEASSTGTYKGANTNINGEGYSSMTFDATSMTRPDFDKWVASIRDSSPALTWDGYENLAIQSTDKMVKYYIVTDDSIFDQVIKKYMNHATPTGHGHGMMNEMEQN